jgi:TPR repeat protein
MSNNSCDEGGQFIGILLDVNFERDAWCTPFLKESAWLGDDRAQFRLGLYYEENGMRIRALKWYHMAADQGNVTAQYNLGIIYRYI